MGFNFSLVQEHLQPTNNIFELHHNTSRAISDKFSKNSIRRTGYDNQRAVNVAGARENVGTLVVQKSGIQIVKLEMIKYARFFGFNGYLFPMELLLSNGLEQLQTNKGRNFWNQNFMHILQSEQNGVVERRNRTLVEAARTMLSAAKVPFFFWTEAIATTYFTQNRSLIIPRHDKTPYHIINGRKLSVKFFHIFRSLCYIVRDDENLDKMKEKGDACIFVGYSTQSRAYRVYNKRTRVIVETIHVNFDEFTLMESDHVKSDPVPQCPTMALEHASLSLGPQSLEYVPHATKTVTTSNELDLLFSPMFDELLNGTATVVSKSSAVTATDVPNQRQQQHTAPSSSTTVATDTPPLNI
ncbi:retrovirus-related pol polyprotein from transposon TNT 1-94 [Tanacetum coccineum]